MRISKKFKGMYSYVYYLLRLQTFVFPPALIVSLQCKLPAGKNPGKDVFVQKEYQKGKQKDGREFTPEELWYYEQRHEELEKRFLKAVLKTTLKSGIRVRGILNSCL